MSEQALRFGVHDGSGHRATTWKLWTKTGAGKSEVYLACRELHGTLKTSLHESGQWHTAYSQQTFEEVVKGADPKFKDRFIEKWPRPSDFASGHTLAFRIVTPWSEVTTPIEPVEEDRFKGVTWLPNAPELMATEIDIVITKPTTSVDGWPGKNLMGTFSIGSLLLENGEIVWAVYWFVDMPDSAGSPKGEVRFFEGRSEEDLKDAKEGELRALAFGTEPDGSRVIYDFAVRIDC
jgi:hypothetical protein